MAVSPKPFTTPQQNQCDMKDPTEHFLWGLAQIPVGNEMMPVQIATARNMSQHLHELGFRHHPKLQTKKLQLPVRGSQSNLNGLARWVPMDAEDPDPLVLPDVKAMNAEEREWVHQELKNVGHINDPKPDIGPVAKVLTLADLLTVKEVREVSANDLPKE